MILAEAAQELPTGLPDGPWWVNLIYVCVLALITGVLVPYLRNKSLAARAEALDSNLSAQGRIVKDLQAFCLERASAIAERDIPVIAWDVLNARANGKEIATQDIKQKLRDLGTRLHDEAIEYFRTRGVDLVAAVGEKYIKQAIEYAANLVSPFPGSETAPLLSGEEMARKITEFGVQVVRERWLAGKKGAES
jgi:hypothetical protein